MPRPTTEVKVYVAFTRPASFLTKKPEGGFCQRETCKEEQESTPMRSEEIEIFDPVNRRVIVFTLKYL